jgi:hypothetical protein
MYAGDDNSNGFDEDHVLRAICSHWISKIDLAKRHKKKVFQEDADTCMSFFNGPRDWDSLMGVPRGTSSTDEIPDTMFKMSVNKTFEFVTIFGPSLYFQNPVRTVNPRVPVAVPPEFFADPYYFQAVQFKEQARTMADSLRASLLGAYLNWTPTNGDLADHSRQAIEEALIKGRGCLWTELKTPPGTEFRVCESLFESVDDLIIDPDANSVDCATWIARRCVHPVWQVERDHNLKPGTLKGNMESQAIQAECEIDDDQKYDRRRGYTNDLLCYWKIYSKMGIGGRLSGVPKRFRGPLEMFGDYVYLVIAKDVPFPLNLPPDLQEQAGEGGPPQEVFDAVAWPTPFWADGGWPVSMLDFHKIPKSPWPMSHLKAALGELRFLNWAMSFLAGKIRNTSRDFIACLKEAGEEVKTAILEGKDLTFLEIDGANHATIQEVVQFLQHPQMNGDIWKVIAAVEENFDKRVGLNELMYGQGGETQIRSAQEATLRSSGSNVRPEDMAKQVESWMTEVSRKEALCSRYHLQALDIEPIMGDTAAQAWDLYVHTTDTNEATRGLEYRIEAGSARKPNKDGQVQRMTEAVQVMLPVFVQVASATGDIEPLNNLLADWAKSRDLDPARYQLHMAPPPPALGQTPQGPPTPTMPG